MEIKAKLDKPYTENERLDFIINKNHIQGYEIRETETELQAWGYTDEEIKEHEKQQRIKELNSKILELKQMSYTDVLYNNAKNIEIYKSVIDGLEETKANIQC